MINSWTKVRRKESKNLLYSENKYFFGGRLELFRKHGKSVVCHPCHSKKKIDEQSLIKSKFKVHSKKNPRDQQTFFDKQTNVLRQKKIISNAQKVFIPTHFLLQILSSQTNNVLFLDERWSDFFLSTFQGKVFQVQLGAGKFLSANKKKFN